MFDRVLNTSLKPVVKTEDYHTSFKVRCRIQKSSWLKSLCFEYIQFQSASFNIKRSKATKGYLELYFQPFQTAFSP